MTDMNACLTMAHGDLIPLCQEIVGLQERPVTAVSNDEIIQAVIPIFQNVVQEELKEDLQPEPGDKIKTNLAEQAYDRVLVELETIDQTARSASNSLYHPHDPSALLDAYYDARALSRQVCPVSTHVAEVSGGRAEADRVIESTCRNLQSHESAVQTKIRSIHWVPDYEPQDVLSVSLGWMVDPTLRRVVDYVGHDQSGYLFIDFQTGYDFQMKNPEWLRGSGPHVDINVSFVLGSIETNSSRQIEVALQPGWMQNIRWGLFVQPELSFGFARNQLNFGEGIYPEWDSSLMLGGAGFLGYQLPTKGISTVDIRLGYQYERSLSGLEYFMQGPKIEISPKWRWPF